MAGIFAFSSSAGSNTTIGGVGIATGMSPANVDNALRQIPAEIRVSFSDDTLETFFNGTAPLALAKGGTGSATASGARTNLGALGEAYRDLPIISKSGSFSLANDERANGIIYTGTAGSLTINPNSSTAINTGSVFVIRNAGSGALTLTRGAGVTLFINGATSSSNGTLSVGGVCTITKWATDTWTAVGSGLSA
jgi:hypothetical protein